MLLNSNKNIENPAIFFLKKLFLDDVADVGDHWGCSDFVIEWLKSLHPIDYVLYPQLKNFFCCECGGGGRTAVNQRIEYYLLFITAV